MKKSTKRSISLALATALVVTGLFTGSTDADAAAKTKKIKMNTKKVTLTVGQKYTLKVKKVTPKKASKKVAYKTSNKKVATVTKKGVITAKKKGTANITVTSKANKKAKAVVKVTVKDASAAPSATPVTTPVATQHATPSIVPAKPTATTVVTTDATSTPTNKPSATPKRTKGPTPTPTAVPTPKYDKPDETAAPYVNLPLTESSFVNEAESSASYVINEDGTLTLTFTSQYGAFNFYIPDNAANYYSDYKSVVLTYKSSGTKANGENNLGHALFDKDHSDADSSDNAQGKHPDWSQQITASDEYTTKVFNVTAECAGNCIRGFQIFNPNELAEGETITITVKSMYFYNEVKEDGFVPSEPDAPEPSDSPSVTDTPEPSDSPSATDTPEPASVNLIVNGDFSDGKNGWATNFNDNGLTVNDGYATISGRWNNYSGIKYTLSGDFKKDDILNFSYDIKLKEAYSSNEGISFGTQFVADDWIVAKDKDNKTVFGSADTWTTVVGTYKVTADTDKFDILIAEGAGGYGPDRKGDFYIDNFVVTRAE